MAKLTMPWGDGELDIDLPARWRLEQVAAADLRPAQDDWPERLAVALNHPGTGQSLSRLLQARAGGRIALVVEDVTRPGPLGRILDVLVRELSFANIDADRVEVVFATGMHPPMEAREVVEKIGQSGRGFRWRSISCRDDSAHVHIGRIGKVDVRIDRGVAEADLRILISSVSPHFQAGFGGGYRLLVPGCSHIDTIRQLNWLGMARRPRQWVGTEARANPMRSLIDAAGVLIDQRHGRSFAVQYLLDGQGLPTSIAAGEAIPTQRMVAKQCSVACGIVTDSLADVLITGAYPRQFDLCQSLKCIANTRWAVRPNGVILVLTPAARGLREVSLPAWPISAAWTRRIVRMVGPEALCSLARRLAPSLAADAAPYFRWAAQTLYRNAVVLLAPALCETGVRIPGLELVGSVDEAISAVERLLPSGQLRTNVFPAGGMTFPILSTVTRPAEEA